MNVIFEKGDDQNDNSDDDLNEVHIYTSLYYLNYQNLIW